MPSSGWWSPIEKMGAYSGDGMRMIGIRLSVVWLCSPINIERDWKSFDDENVLQRWHQVVHRLTDFILCGLVLRYQLLFLLGDGLSHLRRWNRWRHIARNSFPEQGSWKIYTFLLGILLNNILSLRNVTLFMAHLRSRSLLVKTSVNAKSCGVTFDERSSFWRLQRHVHHHSDNSR